MSGGKDRNKARASKAQGWEEAGAEFYQESFPTDLDGAIQRDPAAIATLLPSKQNRAGKIITTVPISSNSIRLNLFLSCK